MKTEYLLFNVIIIACPLLLHSINRKRLYFPQWLPTLFALSAINPFFIIMDDVVTEWFWSFNKTYILGYFIGKLPLEEVLFYFTVPISSLFLWIHIKRKLSFEKSKKFLYIVTIFAFVLIILGLPGKWYTLIMGVLLMITLLLDHLLKTHLYINKTFIFFILIFNILTLIFNSYLTARPIVLYNSTVITNFHIYTIPIEDFFFGINLISLIIIFYEWALLRDKRSIN